MDIITIDFSFEIFNYNHFFNARYKPDPIFLLLFRTNDLIRSVLAKT